MNEPLKVDGRDKFKTENSLFINLSNKLSERADQLRNPLESSVPTLLLSPERVARLFQPVNKKPDSHLPAKSTLGRNKSKKSATSREALLMDSGLRECFEECAYDVNAAFQRRACKQIAKTTIAVHNRKDQPLGGVNVEGHPETIDSHTSLTSVHFTTCVGCSPERHTNVGKPWKNEFGLAELCPYKAEINWKNSHVPPKADVHQVIYSQITNFVCPDLTVMIDEAEFRCHRIVLMGYSKWFERGRQSDQIVDLSGFVNKEAFSVAYSWMMAEGEGGLDFINRNNILEVLILSKKLEIPDLEQQCLACIDNSEMFSEDTAFFLYMDASRLQQIDIKELMVPRIRCFFLPLVASKDFLNLSLSDLCVLLGSNYIQIHSEMEVFMAAVRWLRSNWKERHTCVEAVMKCVRFGLILPNQLVDIRKNPECMEFLEITRNKQVQMLIEDGLAYSIENNLTGNKESHRSRCNLLKLSIPEQRNWAKKKVEHKSYGEFLKFLEKIRSRYAVRLAENVEGRRTVDTYYSHDVNYEDSLRLRPCPVSKPSLIDLNNQESASFKRGKIRTQIRPKRCERTLKDTAATIIQATWRGYMARSRLSPRVSAKLKAMRSKYRKKSLLINVMLCQKYDSPGEGEGEDDDDDRDIKQLDKSFPIRKSSSHESTLTKTSKKNLATSLHFFNDYALLIFGGSIANADNFVGTRNISVLSQCTILIQGGCTVNSKTIKKSEEMDYQMVEETWCFDPCNRQWTIEPAMLTPRKNFSAVTMNGFIYAIGGQDRTSQLISSVERYDPIKKIWEEMAPLPEPCVGAAACVYQNSIWVAGGMKTLKPTLSSQVSCYDAKQNLWIRKPPLRFGRTFATLTTFQSDLYLTGGEKCEDNELDSVDSIDIWDEKNSKWRHRASMPTPRHAHSAVVSGSQIHLIGGLSTKPTTKSSICQVDTFFPKTGLWERRIAPLPLPIVGHTVVALPPSVDL